MASDLMALPHRRKFRGGAPGLNRPLFFYLFDNFFRLPQFLAFTTFHILFSITHNKILLIAVQCRRQSMRAFEVEGPNLKVGGGEVQSFY